MKWLFILSITLIRIVNLFAQPTFNNAYRVASDSAFYTSFGSVIATDSAYYISGVTRDTLHGYLIDRGMLMKIDTNGNKIWSRVYGDTAKTNQTPFSSIITTNQGLLANVGKNFDGTGFLLITDYNGNIISNKNYVSTNPNNRISFSGVTQDIESNFYLLGLYVVSAANTTKIILLKTDSLGNELWRTFYDDLPYRSFGNDIISTNNNEFIIASGKSLNDYQQFSYEEGTWIFKIDSAGTLLKEYHSPTLNRWILAHAISKMKDNGVLFYYSESIRIQGTNPNIPSYDYQGYIGKLDSNLQLVWEKRYGKRWSQFSYAKEKENGHIIIVGSLYSDLSLDSVQLTGWIMELDENGDSIWQREYHLFKGVTQDHLLGDFEILKNGDLVISGYIQNLSSNAGSAFNYWGWLIRTDSLGCIVPGCQLLDNTENVAVVFDNDVVVYPNPASEVVRFRFEKVVEKDALIRVYSGLGQLVGQVSVDNVEEVEMNVSHFNSGMYYYGVYVEGVLVQQGQVLVQR